MSHCRKCGDAGDDALFTVSLPAGVEEDRRLVAHWLPIAPNGCWRCSRRKLPLTPVHARRSRALGRSRSMASGQTTSALLAGRLTQPREVGDPIATAAARAATYAAATPYTHASSTTTTASLNADHQAGTAPGQDQHGGIEYGGLPESAAISSCESISRSCPTYRG